MDKSSLTKTSEERLQFEIIQWWDRVCSRYNCEPSDLMHIPNGLVGERVRLRCLGLGLRPGYPDLALFIPKGKFHGMFIELKRPGRSTERGMSADQRRIIERLSGFGYVAFCSNSFDDITMRIMRYLELRP